MVLKKKFTSSLWYLKSRYKLWNKNKGTDLDINSQGWLSKSWTIKNLSEFSSSLYIFFKNANTCVAVDKNDGSKFDDFDICSNLYSHPSLGLKFVNDNDKWRRAKRSECKLNDEVLFQHLI